MHARVGASRLRPRSPGHRCRRSRADRRNRRSRGRARPIRGPRRDASCAEPRTPRSSTSTAARSRPPTSPPAPDRRPRPAAAADGRVRRSTVSRPGAATTRSRPCSTNTGWPTLADSSSTKPHHGLQTDRGEQQARAGVPSRPIGRLALITVCSQLVAPGRRAPGHAAIRACRVEQARGSPRCPTSPRPASLPCRADSDRLADRGSRTARPRPAALAARMPCSADLRSSSRAGRSVSPISAGDRPQAAPRPALRKDLDPVLQRVEQQIGAIGQQLAGVGGTGVEGDAQHDRRARRAASGRKPVPGPRPAAGGRGSCPSVTADPTQQRRPCRPRQRRRACAQAAVLSRRIVRR